MTEYDNPMYELLKVKHIGSVVDFREDFYRDMTKLDLYPNHAINVFLWGLKPEISDIVRIQRTYFPSSGLSYC